MVMDARMPEDLHFLLYGAHPWHARHDTRESSHAHTQTGHARTVLWFVVRRLVVSWNGLGRQVCIRFHWRWIGIACLGSMGMSCEAIAAQISFWSSHKVVIVTAVGRHGF